MVGLLLAIPGSASAIAVAPEVRAHVGDIVQEGELQGVGRQVTLEWSTGCDLALPGVKNMWAVDLLYGDSGEASPYAGIYVDEGTAESGGSATVAVSPGVALRPFVSASCEYKPQGQKKVSATGEASAEQFVIPPFLRVPTVTQPVKADTVRYLSPNKLPRLKRFYADVEVVSDLVGGETMEARFVGPGINVTREFTQEQLLNGEAYVGLRAKKKGVIRHWVTMRPYGVHSQVVSLRVR